MRWHVRGRKGNEARAGEAHLWCEGETWIAKDVETGVASRGESHEAALEMLDEAVALHTGEAGREVTEEDFRELGIDMGTVADEPGEPDAPWFGDVQPSSVSGGTDP